MPPSPEDETGDLEGTHRRAASTSAEEFAALVPTFRAWYAEGELGSIWDERCRYGSSVGEDQLPPGDWFWFNAFAALAGLKMRKMPGFPLDNFCGLADSGTDNGDPTQIETKNEINRLYFGS